MNVQPVQQPIRPSRVWYLVAGALVVGAVVWLAAGDETVEIPSFRLSVAPVGGGQELTVRPYEGSSLYTSGSYSGRAVGTVQVDQPGRYLLRTEGEPQVVQAHVAVGEEIGSNLDLRAIPPRAAGAVRGVVLAVVASRSAASRPAGDRRRWPPGANKRRSRRAGLLIPAGAMSFATGTASGGPSTSPIAEPKGSTLCERHAGWSSIGR
jgi:hypothetical protein